MWRLSSDCACDHRVARKVGCRDSDYCDRVFVAWVIGWQLRCRCRTVTDFSMSFKDGQPHRIFLDDRTAASVGSNRPRCVLEQEEEEKGRRKTIWNLNYFFSFARTNQSAVSRRSLSVVLLTVELLFVIFAPPFFFHDESEEQLMSSRSRFLLTSERLLVFIVRLRIAPLWPNPHLP